MANDDIIKLLQDVLSGNQIDPLSQSLLQDIKALVDSQVEVTNRQQLEVKEIKAIFAAFRAFLKSEGINSTKLLGKLTQMQGALTKDGTIVKLDKLERALSNLLSSGVLQTQMANQRGDNSGLLNSSSMSSPLVKQIITELSKNQKTNTLLGLNNLQRWWVSWANGYTVDQDKKRKGMVAAIIDGLAANKFVGGALQDSVKLFGLLAGSWVKNKVGGNLGAFLGAGTVVLTQVVAAVVPMVISALLQAGFNRLFLGPMISQTITKGLIAQQAAQLGLGTVIGTTTTASMVTGLSRSGIVPGFGSQQIGGNIQGLGAPNQTVPSTVLGFGSQQVGGSVQGLGAQGQTTVALNQNTAALTKNTGWLGKITNSPIMKAGGSLLKVAGNLLKVAGKVLKPLAYIDALSQGWGAIKDLGRGNYKGAAWRAGAGVTSALGTASLIPAIQAAVPTGGLSLLIPGILYLLSSWMKGKAKESEGASIDKLLGTSPGRIFWVSPQHHLAGSSNGSTPYGSTHGGRGYVSSNLVNALDPRTHLSKDFKSFVKNQEGFRSYAYDDKTGKRLNVGDIPIGTPTIGWGRAGKHRVKPGMTATKAQAEKWLNEDIYSAKGNLSSALKHWGFTAEQAQFPQEIYDMLVDSYFQSGFNPMGWKSPTQLVGLLKNKDWEGVKRFMSTYKHSSATRNAARVRYIDSHEMKAIPKANSQQTVTIQTPSVSSTTEEVKAPEEPKVETKKEEKTSIDDILKMDKPTIDGKSDKKEEEKVTGGLTADIAKAILNGVDIPGNDTTFDMMTKCNMAGLLGGY